MIFDLFSLISVSAPQKNLAERILCLKQYPQIDHFARIRRKKEAPATDASRQIIQKSNNLNPGTAAVHNHGKQLSRLSTHDSPDISSGCS